MSHEFPNSFDKAQLLQAKLETYRTVWTAEKQYLEEEAATLRSSLHKEAAEKNEMRSNLERIIKQQDIQIERQKAEICDLEGRLKSLRDAGRKFNAKYTLSDDGDPLPAYWNSPSKNPPNTISEYIQEAIQDAICDFNRKGEKKAHSSDEPEAESQLVSGTHGPFNDENRTDLLHRYGGQRRATVRDSGEYVDLSGKKETVSSPHNSPCEDKCERKEEHVRVANDESEARNIFDEVFPYPSPLKEISRQNLRIFEALMARDGIDEQRAKNIMAIVDDVAGGPF